MEENEQQAKITGQEPRLHSKNPVSETNGYEPWLDSSTNLSRCINILENPEVTLEDIIKIFGFLKSIGHKEEADAKPLQEALLRFTWYGEDLLDDENGGDLQPETRPSGNIRESVRSNAREIITNYPISNIKEQLSDLLKFGSSEQSTAAARIYTAYGFAAIPYLLDMLEQEGQIIEQLVQMLPEGVQYDGRAADFHYNLQNAVCDIFDQTTLEKQASSPEVTSCIESINKILKATTYNSAAESCVRILYYIKTEEGKRAHLESLPHLFKRISEQGQLKLTSAACNVLGNLTLEEKTSNKLVTGLISDINKAVETESNPEIAQAYIDILYKIGTEEGEKACLDAVISVYNKGLRGEDRYLMPGKYTYLPVMRYLESYCTRIRSNSIRGRAWELIRDNCGKIEGMIGANLILDMLRKGDEMIYNLNLSSQDLTKLRGLLFDLPINSDEQRAMQERGVFIDGRGPNSIGDLEKTFKSIAELLIQYGKVDDIRTIYEWSKAAGEKLKEEQRSASTEDIRNCYVAGFIARLMARLGIHSSKIDSTFIHLGIDDKALAEQVRELSVQSTEGISASMGFALGGSVYRIFPTTF